MNSRPTLPPGLNNTSGTSCPKEVVKEPEKSLSKSAKKNERRKHKRQEKSAADVSGDKHSVTKTLEAMSLTSQNTGRTVTAPPDKRAKTLRKKIRQIDELQAQIDSGEIESPSNDQLEKIARLDEIQTELDKLITEFGV